MFKDYDKYLSTSLKVYLFVLGIVFIMKLVGLDYFGLDVNNPIINIINNYCIKFNIQYLWYLFTYYIYIKFIISISIKRKLTFKENILWAFISLLILMFIKPYLNNLLILIFDILYLEIVCFITNKRNNKFEVFKRNILVLLLNFIFQIISLFIRNIGQNDIYFDNFICGIIMNLDYILLSLVYYEIWLKGDKIVCGEVFLSLQKKKNLKNLLRKLQENLHKFKNLDKENKIAFVIYFILSLIWNVLSVAVILLIAKLNDTLIECIFILTSFWLSKRSFGKAFHLPSMAQCFLVSNLSYYLLNRLTTPLGISILVPVMLGVGLSYLTSKLVKKAYKPLYRGMPEELFEETILKVVDKDSDKYRICYDFYIKKENAIKLANRYNYTEAGIRKIKDRINEKIKKL